jgi:hypothetical protein
MCYNCVVPLVSTFDFSKHEFYCLDCGRHYTFFGPMAVDETPELVALAEKYNSEYKILSDGIIGDGAIKVKTCQTCADKHEPHSYHATMKEFEANVIARSRLAARAGGWT